MPWLEVDVRSQRISFVVRAHEPGCNRSALCREYGISRKTGYKWLRRFAEVGSLAQLDELPRRPHRSPRRTPDALEERVEALRRLYGEAGRKISIRLAREGVHLAPRTVDRILKRRGLTGESGHPAATSRFERSRPNELVQMDFKGHYLMPGGGPCHPLSLLDDHSRYAVGLVALDCQNTEPVRESLIRTWESHGVPQSLLIDHGQPWWGSTNGHGLTRLSVFLIRQGVNLIYSGIAHPQTQGKVERFHRTLKQRLGLRRLPTTIAGFQDAFDAFRHDYNHYRPHEALGDQPPVSRYVPSAKAYVPDPPTWDYPPGSEVYVVNDSGLLYLEGRYRFVSHALAGRRVHCQRFESRLLVTYRHMQIREIDLASGRTYPIVRPANTGHPTSSQV